MDIAEKKRLIVDRIETIEEEWLIRAIEKLLDIEDNDESPDWHLPLVKEAYEKYKANPGDVVKWEDIKMCIRDRSRAVAPGFNFTTTRLLIPWFVF